MTGTRPAILPSRRDAWSAAILGVSLGAASIAPDILPEPQAEILTPIVSSGFGWGMTALAGGFLASSRKSAPMAGIGALTLAAVTYYFLILTLTSRWRHRSGNTEASLVGPASVAEAAGFWLLVAVCGGAIMGYLGYVIRHDSGRALLVSAGMAFGLLAGEGGYALFHAAFIWVGPVDSFMWAKLQSALVQLLLCLSVLVAALRSGRRHISWAAFLAVAAAALVVNIGAWHLIQSVRLTL
ncbi:DUF6518 family protein [Micromonospora sp. NPDC050187]|uniref:DUF6518 family protein n=1 Tax=Micromonospora sp. NPDC050187 TaxID=3364277 RepID=UPI0037A5DB1D